MLCVISGVKGRLGSLNGDGIEKIRIVDKKIPYAIHLLGTHAMSENADVMWLVLY